MHSLFKGGNKQQDEVDDLVRRYISTTTLTPAIVELAKTPGYMDLFTEVLAHHISLIKSRSQAVEDGHITVYDKALLILTQNGKNLNQMGGIELFKDEILGIRNAEDVETIEAMLGKNLALRTILSSATAHPKQFDEKTVPSSQPTESAPAIATPSPSESKEEESKPAATSPPKEAATPLMARMLKIFSTAQEEYHYTPDSDREGKFRAAKFLRDSAENTLKYVVENDTHHYMIPVLQNEFEMARHKAVEMNGGKKRRFEIDPKWRPPHRVRRLSREREFRGPPAPDGWDTYRP